MPDNNPAVSDDAALRIEEWAAEMARQTHIDARPHRVAVYDDIATMTLAADVECSVPELEVRELRDSNPSNLEVRWYAEAPRRRCVIVHRTVSRLSDAEAPPGRRYDQDRKYRPIIIHTPWVVHCVMTRSGKYERILTLLAKERPGRDTQLYATRMGNTQSWGDTCLGSAGPRVWAGELCPIVAFWNTSFDRVPATFDGLVPADLMTGHGCATPGNVNEHWLRPQFATMQTQTQTQNADTLVTFLPYQVDPLQWQQIQTTTWYAPAGTTRTGTAGQVAVANGGVYTGYGRRYTTNPQTSYVPNVQAQGTGTVGHANFTLAANYAEWYNIVPASAPTTTEDDA